MTQTRVADPGTYLRLRTKCSRPRGNQQTNLVPERVGIYSGGPKMTDLMWRTKGEPWVADIQWRSYSGCPRVRLKASDLTAEQRSVPLLQVVFQIERQSCYNYYLHRAVLLKFIQKASCTSQLISSGGSKITGANYINSSRPVTTGCLRVLNDPLSLKRSTNLKTHCEEYYLTFFSTLILYA